MTTPSLETSPPSPILSEIPILHHCDTDSLSSAHPIRRYIVNDIDDSITIVSRGGTTDDSTIGSASRNALHPSLVSSPALPSTASMEDNIPRLLGCASTQTFQRGKIIVTTFASVTDPSLLTLTVFNDYVTSDTAATSINNDDKNKTSLKMIEIDLSKVTSIGTIVQTTVFSEKLILPRGGFHNNKVILTYKILFIDQHGNILTLYFHKSNLKPLDYATALTPPVQKHSLIQIITELSSLNQQQELLPHTGYTLVPSQITYLNSTTLLIAAAPHLLCLHLPTSKIVAWTERKCLDTFYQGRRKTISGILRCAGGLLIGRSEGDMNLEDLEVWEREESKKNNESMIDIGANDRLDSTSALTVVWDDSAQNEENGAKVEESDDDEDIENSFGMVEDDQEMDGSSNAIIDMDHRVAKAVFSLHSDGTIRMWFLLDNFGRKKSGDGRNKEVLYPFQMKILHDPISHSKSSSVMLPPCHMWSPSNDSVFLSGVYYRKQSMNIFDEDMVNDGYDGGHFVLGVCIRTAENFVLQSSIPDPDSDNNGSASPCHLTLFHGGFKDYASKLHSSADKDIISTMKHRAVKLKVPSDANSLAGMQFVLRLDDVQNPWNLHAFFNSRTITDFVLGSYEASNVAAAMIASGESIVEPNKLESVHTLDTMAEIEREELVMESNVLLKCGGLPLSLETFDSNMDLSAGTRVDHSNKAVEKEMKMLDCIYMKRLFRPSAIRATPGNSPSRYVVRNALRKLIPGLKRSNKELNGGISSITGIGMGYASGGDSPCGIEVETLLAVREWGKLEEARAITEARRRKRISTRGNDSTSSEHRRRNSPLASNLITSPRKEKEPPTRRTGSSSSIYYHFASVRKSEHEKEEDNLSDENIDLEHELEKDDVDKEQKALQERERRLTSHQNRWTKVLLAVWDEEAKLRSPLSFAVLPPNPVGGDFAVLIRAGVTSTLALSPSRDISSVKDELDLLALSVLRLIQNNTLEEDAGREKLAELQLLVWETVSKSKLLLTGGKELSAKMGEIGSTAVLSMGDKIKDFFPHTSKEDISQWLNSPLPSLVAAQSLSGPGLATQMEADDVISGFMRDNIPQITTCASILARQYVYSIQQITLARCLLVFGMMFGMTLSHEDHISKNKSITEKIGPEQAADALRSHLHSTAVTWVNSQMITISSSSNMDGVTGVRRIPPLHAFNISSNDSLDQTAGRESPTSEPPDARPRHQSFGILSKKITVLDLHLSQLAQNLSTKTASFSDSLPVIGLVQSYLKVVFSAKIGGDPNLFELKALPSGLTAERPQLSLRLLAPYIEYPPLWMDQDSRCFRNEMAAECLLSEVMLAVRNKSLHCPHIIDLQKRASDLLLKSTPFVEHINVESLETVFDILRSVPNGSAPRSIGGNRGYYDGLLAEMLQSIIDENSMSVCEDAKTLCKLQTVRNLFLPWVVSSRNINTDALTIIIGSFPESVPHPKDLVHHIVRIFLKLSNLMRRVSVLERHSLAGSNLILTSAIKDESTKLILSAIKDGIGFIQQHLPPNMYEENMVEYHTLWSSAFRHAVIGQHWDEAHNACLSNPIKERRVNNFKRLVIAMVDAGFLGKLIDMIPFTVVNGHTCVSKDEKCVKTHAADTTNDDDAKESVPVSESTGEIDIYELAAETLADAACDQASFGAGVLMKANYRGCLYALHARRGDWRRCAQAMDFYGIIGLELMASNNSQDDSSLESSAQKTTFSELKVIEDLSLSALTSSQVIQLVPNPNHRFIVSGELEPYPMPAPYRNPLFSNIADAGSTSLKRTSKRGRSGDFTLDASSESEEIEKTSMNRPSRLALEKDLSIRATKTLALRTLYKDSLSPDSLSKILQSSDLEVIDALTKLGYYQQGISVARGRSNLLDGASLDGRDVFADALGYILCRHLAPSTVRTSRPFPRNAVEGANEWERLDEVINNNLSEALMIRPTPDQLRFESGNSFCPPPLNVQASWRSQFQSMNGSRGTVAMELLRTYTCAYSNAENSLAIEVAGTLLDLDSGRSDLPLWLTNLITGENNTTSGSGLFGRCSPFIVSSSAPNPVELVRIFMKRGLYVQACNIVTSILLGNGDKREKEAPSRLPEKGSIDFVPYETIDILWNLIEEESCRLDCDQKRRTSNISARDKMEKALEKHFELMRISEMGILSARALTSF